MHLSAAQLQKISNHRPAARNERSLMRAAVAIILRDTEHGTEFLLMQRAFHEMDPWSGQMSFPGGKIDPEDATAKAAAIRETEEEVGIVLREPDYIGRLDDLYGLKVDNQYSVHVAPFVFKPQRELKPYGNHEVADLVWVPLSWVEDPANKHDYIHPRSNNLKMPAVMIDANKDQILWGLSLRMLSIMYELLGRDLMVLDAQQRADLKRIEEQNMDSRKLDDITQRVLKREAG
jgi:8-oxo-dGTP pyrophosphatase MutT (NUDIX family)